MKRVIALLLILMCVIGAAGCQKTPESPVVVGKDNDKMIETAGSLEDKSLTIGEQLSAPESVKMNFKDQTGKLKFSVDAEVIVPDAEASKIIRVTAHEITQDEVDTWTEVLFADETLYTLDSFEQMTKEEITEELLKLKKRLAELGEDEDGKVLYEDVPAISEDSQGAAEQPVAVTEGDELRMIIKNYEEQLKTAPEKPVFTEAANKLEISEGGNFSYVQFAVPNKNGTGIRAFSAANYGHGHPIVYVDRNENGFSGNSYAFSIEEMEHSYVGAGEKYREKLDAYRLLDDPAITSQHAIEMGNDFLAKLDINGYVISRAELAISEPAVTDAFGNIQGNVLRGWRLEYRREIDGIPVSYANTYQMASPDNGEPWCYERIMLFVTDDGIAEVFIEELNDIGETVVENCKLMSFEDIIDVFKKMMPVQYNVTAMGEALLNAEWNVTSIEFGYTRVSEENADYTGILVPTWSFYGTELGTYRSEDLESGKYSFSCNQYPILTINAIDGSIIDRSKGY